MPTSDQNARPLSVRDAINYLDAIKDQNQDKPEVYNQFFDIIKDFRSEVIDTPAVMQRVSCLFHGNPGLIQGFNTFLPVGYRIDISDTITFTTPSSTTTQRINQNSNSEGGFFAGASQFRATQCEMNENHGHQFNNHYHNSGSKPAALMWAQLLIMTPPSAFIAIGHGGHLYLNKLHQYLNTQKLVNPVHVTDQRYKRFRQHFVS